MKKIILSWSRDGAARLWDVQTGILLHSFAGDGTSVTSAQWNHTENIVMVTTEGGNIYRYYTQMNDILTEACNLATRSLTSDEWNNVMDTPYRPTCPTAPIPPDAIEAVTNEAKTLTQNGDLPAAADRLGQLVGWLRANGQFNTFGVERAAWLAALQAGENPWAEEE